MIFLEIESHPRALRTARDDKLFDFHGFRPPKQIERKTGTAGDREVPLKRDIAIAFPNYMSLGHLHRRTEPERLRQFNLAAEPFCHIGADSACGCGIYTERGFGGTFQSSVDSQRGVQKISLGTGEC